MERDELAQYLDSLKREECYRVDEVLKESTYEVTQRVSFIGANGAAGPPLIRKIIKRESGLGSAYPRIFAAQQSGQRFKHIPNILECYSHDDDLVVVMEYIWGETLQDLVYRRDPSVQLASDVFPRLCDAVTELHEDFNPPIIHRDLKPSNVILSTSGLVIIDFGIARDYHDGASADTTRFGTRAFAPPEQYGFGQTTVQSDVYALGMMLYFCLTESIPDADFPSELAKNTSIPEPLRNVIEQATAFDPDRRFKNSQALKAAFLAACSPVAKPALSNARQGDSGVATSPTPPMTPETPAPRNVTEAQSGQRDIPQGTPGKTSTFGRVRNGILIGVAAIFLLGSIGAYVNPNETTASNPDWLNVYGYFAFMPIVIVGTAVLLSDKTWIKKVFPEVRNWKLGHWIGAYLALWGLLILITGVLYVCFPQQ